MFYLLLESIFIYGNLSDDTNILVYTSTAFMNIIKQSHLFNDEKIKFEINDKYDTVDKACKSRLDLFNLKSINNYQKILYLDTDILIKDDINKVFNVCKKDILYVLEEGEIDSNLGYWGTTLFGDEADNYNDKTAFTAGILLFNNCEKIKDLFLKINEDIVKRPYNLPTYEQGYIIYNAFKYNVYNNRILKSLAVNNNNDFYSNYVIYHFPPDTDVMSIFLNSIKDVTINNHIQTTKKYIDNYLSVIKNFIENIFTSVYIDEFLDKRKNISNLVLNKNIKNVMQIGFNYGFSTLLMLMTNPNIHITCFDKGDHKYTIPCYKILKQTFGERINIIIGDSTKTLQNITDVYDLIHIDVKHSTEVASCDIINSYKASRQGTILIMDNYNDTNLHCLWDICIIKYNLKSLDISRYESLNQDMKYV
jgi:hypothetical protein